MRRFSPILLGVVLATLLTGSYLGSRTERDGARLFDQVLTLVQDRYVDSVEINALFEKAARGLVAELNDPYSELLSPKQVTAFNTTTGGRYGGVGMLIEDQQGTIVISRVYPNTPAERAGIFPGDRIIEVDGQSTRGWKTAQVSEKMQGEPGSEVKAKFARVGMGTPIDVTFTRAVIRIPAIPYTLLLAGGVGYIPFQTFNETSARELATQLTSLRDAGATRYVLDLRGNGGGYLDQSLEIANLFLPRGQAIAAVRSRAEPESRYLAESAPLEPTAPLIVLTDGFSASASEIVAGALQDHDRALVLGTTTFGKGLVQSVYRLDGGWALKVTTGKWTTPLGRTIQRPTSGEDAEVPDTTGTADAITGRPTYTTPAGRTVYGGGAIRPDIVVRADTISTPERVLVEKIASRQEFHIVSADLALEFKDRVRPDFTVTEAWRAEFRRRLVAQGLDVDDAVWRNGVAYVDRFLGNQVARIAFGDSTAKRRLLPDDNQLTRALELIRHADSQQALFTLAAPLARGGAND